MAYTSIANSEIDTDSPITTGLMTKIRDNIDSMRDGTGIQDDKIINRHIATDAVNQDSLAANTVGQSEIKTTSEEDSLSSATTLYYLTSAGIYALSVESKTDAILSDNVEVVGFNKLFTTANTSYGHYVGITVNNALDIGYAYTTYIPASPPYDLGDGEIPLFVWVMLDSNSNIIAISTSDTPTWAYNGPTDITPDHVSNDNGVLRKFKNVRSIDEETGEVTIIQKEIDMNMKNADMELFSNPFIANDLNGRNIILLDPPNTLYLSELMQAGESVNELLHKGYLRLDNATINRAVPSGVIPSKFRWKNTQSRAGEMLKDKRLKRGPFVDD